MMEKRSGSTQGFIHNGSMISTKNGKFVGLPTATAANTTFALMQRSSMPTTSMSKRGTATDMVGEEDYPTTDKLMDNSFALRRHMLQIKNS